MNRPREALIGDDTPHQMTDGDIEIGAPSPKDSAQRNRLRPNLDREDLWFSDELSRAKELSSQIAESLDELRELRELLSRRYRPDLEGQVQRLSIERDEMIISWGQALLGLCESGASLHIKQSSGELLPVYHSSRFLSSSSNSIPFIKPQSATPQSPEKVNAVAESDHIVSAESSGAQSPLESHADASEANSASLAEETEELQDDLGVADAPKVSLTQFSLDQLREQMLSPKRWSEESDVEEDVDSDSTEVATRLVLRLGRPRELTTGQIKEHLIELESEVECCQSWSTFDQAVQHAVVTLVTSRLRAMQDHIGESPFDQDRIAKMFRRLTRFSSDFRPGFIHGLSRDKIPEHDSWKSDEKHAWSRLEVSLNIRPQLPTLTPEREKQVHELRELISREADTPDFSNVLRAAVTDCLNAGFNQDNPHLVKALQNHLSHLSGKRFKKLRLAASNQK